jgi:hypothetical protein
LTRDAITCGIWTRLCCELRGRAEGYHLHEYIGEPTETRGDTKAVLQSLDGDIGSLNDARAMLSAVEQTPLDATVELDDVWRFMPRAWERADEPLAVGADRDCRGRSGGRSGEDDSRLWL